MSFIQRSVFLAILGLFASTLSGQVRFARLASPTVVYGETAHADFNGDGYVDLLAVARTGIELHLGDAMGRYGSSRSITKNVLYLKVRPGDFDGDGDVDIVAFTFGGSRAVLLDNDGTGKFRDVTATRLPRVTGLLQAIQVGDLEGDGDLDVVMAFSTSPLVVLENRKGVFRDVSTRVATHPRWPFGLVLHDVDGNGRLDLVTIGATAVEIRLHESTGAIGRRPLLVKSSDLPWTIALGDVDKDGDVDLFVGGLYRDRFYEAKGLSWGDATAKRFPKTLRALSARHAAFADLDEDGDLDLVIPKTPRVGLVDRTRVYINDGRGVFSDATPAVLGKHLPLLGTTRLHDVDQDGDIDIAYFENDTAWKLQYLQVEHNLLRHVHAKASAKLGTTLRVEFYAKAGFAPAGQVSWPLVDLRSAVRARRAGSFGIFGLEPTSAVALPGVAHGSPSGLGVMRLPVPNTAALAGRTLWIQALVLHDLAQVRTWRFSNVHATKLVR